MTNSAQSELYLGPQRQSGDYAKMLRGQPDAVVFNSYYDQYLYAPLHVAAGQPGTSTPASRPVMFPRSHPAGSLLFAQFF